MIAYYNKGFLLFPLGAKKWLNRIISFLLTNFWWSFLFSKLTVNKNSQVDEMSKLI